ncbi:MAG: tyrosine-type recombinase/integrase [Gemmatimonadota bacterium]
MGRRQLWSHSVGERPNVVRVFERTPGGILYARVWSPTARGGEGGWRKRSLAHRDRDRAKQYAHEQHAKLRQGCDDIRAGKVTLARLFSLYRTHRTPKKRPGGRQADERRIELWTRFLGVDKDPHRVTLAEWERFIDLRSSGALDAHGELVSEGKRSPARARTVEADLRWLRWCLNWGTKWRDREGRYLLRENPVRGYEIPTEKNPRRPVATRDRYEALREVTDHVTMETRWEGRREVRRSYLSELLDIAVGTGRRLSAICRLRFGDLRPEVPPHGAIRWPADTDKTGRESVVPISPLVRAALDRVLMERPGIGDAYLFPSPTSPGQAISRHLADAWLREAEKLAGLGTQEGSLWHAWRRMWATERKHLPAVDVAKAGGWSGPETLANVYQQADHETMLAVVLGGGELREAK